MLELIKEYNLDKFNVKIYKNAENSDVVDIETIDSLTTTLNNQDYPRGIVETLQSLAGVKKISVSDKDNNILVVSANELLESDE
jgi:hypothetical protein